MKTKAMEFLSNQLFLNEKKWQKTESGTYKLKSPDLINDKLYSFGQIEKAEESTNANDKAPQRLVIAGMANANVIDRMDEIVEPKGLDFSDFMKNPILLLGHNYNLPIGQVMSLDIQDDGVHFDAWIGDESKAELTQVQKDTKSLVKQGILKTVSIGFIPLEYKRPTYNDQGDMVEPLVIVKWKLLELSVVAVPANQDSVFTVKEVDQNNNISKGNTMPTGQKDGSEDNEIKTFMSEIKTLLSGMSSDIKTVVTNSDTLVKSLEKKVDPKPEEEKPKEKPEEDEEEEMKKQLKSIQSTLVSFAEVLQLMAKK